MAYTIYLSSTLDDLKPERDAARRALAGHGVKESYNASENSLIETCLDDVGRCDAYMLIVGLRYGYRPESATKNPDKKSITELEFERAVEKNIPRFVFVKDKNAITAPNIDAVTKQNPEALIEAFRTRVSDGKLQVPATFSTPDQLELALVKAFSEFRARREQGSALMGSSTEVRHPAELHSDLAIICATGTDNAAAVAINARGDSRFRAIEVSPLDARYLLELDRAIRNSRAAAFLITPASLQRYKEQKVLEVGLKAVACRTGRAFVLLDGVEEAALPQEWRGTADLAVTVLNAPSVADTKSKGLLEAFQDVRANSPTISNDRRVGVPCMIVALTGEKLAAFKAKSASSFAGFKDTERENRKKQFTKLEASIKKTFAGWPTGFYGDRVVDWRPFGSTGPSSGEIVARAFERINDEKPGSRTRRLLRDFRLEPRMYQFEDFCLDRLGSRAMIEEARDRGCLVLLDELALLQRELREHLKSFFSGPRVAIVSASPCDPAHLPMSDLLADASHLHVGTLLARFKDQEDPRCELSLNSEARLQRWLRLVLPELVTTLSFDEVDHELVDRSGELLEKSGP